jgi:hypothetical protein
MITFFSHFIPVINAFSIQKGLEAGAFCECIVLNAECEKRAKTESGRNYWNV